jgi:hypothetical protein
MQSNEMFRKSFLPICKINFLDRGVAPPAPVRCRSQSCYGHQSYRYGATAVATRSRAVRTKNSS